MKLKGQHIFVTGGADGIGAAIVLDALLAGARTSFCDINESKGLAYAESLRAKGLEVCFAKADVGLFDSLKIAHDTIV